MLHYYIIGQSVTRDISTVVSPTKGHFVLHFVLHLCYKNLQLFCKKVPLSAVFSNLEGKLTLNSYSRNNSEFHRIFYLRTILEKDENEKSSILGIEKSAIARERDRQSEFRRYPRTQRRKLTDKLLQQKLR